MTMTLQPIRPVVEPVVRGMGAVLGPFGRAAGFYGRAWVRWVRGPRGPSSIPPITPSPALFAQAAGDELVLSVARALNKPRTSADLDRILREAEDARVLFQEKGWLDNPAKYHRTPKPAEVDVSHGHRFPVGYIDARFESEYKPRKSEPGRDRWLSDKANRTGHLWLLRHDEPRPWIVCIHGAGMGLPLPDLGVFRAAWLHHGLGLNVAMPVMPLHGPRRDGSGFGAGFPNDDPLDTVHGFSQAVWDIRRVIRWIRAEEPESAIALQGVSLGGYTAALVAGLEGNLACVIAGIPAVDFIDLYKRHAPRSVRSDPRFDKVVDASRDLHRVISPLEFEPKVPEEDRYIYAGAADRLIHPRRQVGRLWEHWNQPEIHWFEGSHVGFFLSRPVGDFLRGALEASGVIEPADATDEAMSESS
jgi:hypothetical protein